AKANCPKTTVFATNCFESIWTSEVFLTAPASGISQTATLPPSLYSQPLNAIRSYPPHTSAISHNTNNGLWTHQNSKYILGQPNSYFNSNADPFILPFYNRNPS
ncbi:hypothetical protein WUBG_14385, partial [Wuchereria bancrofti]